MIVAKSFAVMKEGMPLEPWTLERRNPRKNDVVVDIQYCGICHSDIHQVKNEWGGARFPMVPGHEIVGRVSMIGDAVTLFKIGDRVGIGCFIDSCRRCSPCQRHLEQYCENGANFTYNSLEKDGVTPTQGGYSNKIVVDENYLFRIPSNLPLEQTAPLLCAGITLYSPLKHWKAGPGQAVAIVGLGGLGHMGVKLANAMGAEVTVLSQSPKKSNDAKRLGAHHFYSTSDPQTFSTLSGHFDLIINTVSAAIDWNQYLQLLKLDGTMVLVGIPESQIPIGAFSLIGGRRSLAGSLIGGTAETQEMLDFCGKHGITSEIELIPIQKVNEAFERVQRSDVRYRFVIDMATL